MRALMKPSRIAAVAILLAAVLWIASGAFGPHAADHAGKPAAAAAKPAQRVTVTEVAPESHPRAVSVSGVTQADKRAFAYARLAGVLRDIKVSRGSRVKAGDVVATLADEGREAAVRQAQAQLDQRRTELQANRQLIQRGTIARNQLGALEAAVAQAELALANAKAELDKLAILAPLDGLVDQVPVQVGQAVQVGGQIAEVIGPDPMLAVGSVTEKERGRVRVGQSAEVRLVDGRKTAGTVGFVSLAAEARTRTYRVEVRFPNSDAAIADGVTSEIVIATDPVVAAPVPRSALVFSDQGILGVRIVQADNKALFKPVGLVEDGRSTVWVSGLDGRTRVITVGQDFVKDGDAVEPVTAVAAGAPA